MVHEILKIETPEKLITLTRNRGTFNYTKYDTIAGIKTDTFIQFSFKDIWWKPKKEYIRNLNMVIVGWLFLYIGYSRERILLREEP